MIILLLCYQSVFHIKLRNHRPAHLTPPWPSSHFKLWLSNWPPWCFLSLAWSYLALLFHYYMPCPAPSSNPAMLSNILLDFVFTMITLASTVFFTFQEYPNMSPKQNWCLHGKFFMLLTEAISICSDVPLDFLFTLSLPCPSSSTTIWRMLKFKWGYIEQMSKSSCVQLQILLLSASRASLRSFIAHIMMFTIKSSLLPEVLQFLA